MCNSHISSNNFSDYFNRTEKQTLEAIEKTHRLVHENILRKRGIGNIRVIKTTPENTHRYSIDLSKMHSKDAIDQPLINLVKEKIAALPAHTKLFIKQPYNGCIHPTFLKESIDAWKEDLKSEKPKNPNAFKVFNGKEKNPNTHGFTSFNKLALLWKKNDHLNRNGIFWAEQVVNELVKPKDIEAETRKTLKKRAAAKFGTLVYLKHLIDCNSSLKNSYCNTLTCCESVINKDGKLISSYCKNRWCIVCCRNKTANLINCYKPQIANFENPQFVTHTFANCQSNDLKKMLGLYSKFFREYYLKINDKLKKLKSAAKKKKLTKEERQQRENELQQFIATEKLRGIRKIECTYNAKENSYHPHAHYVVANELQARNLTAAWLRYCRKNGLKIDARAQKIVKCDANISKELFKYFSKMMCNTGEYEVKKVKKGSKTEKIKVKAKRFYIEAMDNIFCSFKGQQVFTAFGIKKLKDEDDKTATLTATETESFVYNDDVHDWINEETGELLSGYKPSNWEKRLKDKIIVPPPKIKKYKIYGDTFKNSKTTSLRECWQLDFVQYSELLNITFNS